MCGMDNPGTLALIKTFLFENAKEDRRGKLNPNGSVMPPKQNGEVLDF